jgi:hypothetical protein
MTDSQEIAELLARFKALADGRREWETHWEELAQVMLPRRAGFISEPQPGAKQTDKIFDGTPMLARRALAGAIDALLKPKTSRWFRIKTEDEGLNERDEVREWLAHAEDRLYAALYNPRARFIQRSGEVDDDLVTFGTGVLFVGESHALDRLSFRSAHLRDAYIAENGDGEIDTIFLRLRLTARQAAQRWGADALGAKTREALARGRPDEKFQFVQAVMPRVDRDPRRADNRNLPFASVVIDVASEHKVGESGFHEFPFAIPRWDTASGETYGRSPGMIALPDANTLQQMGKTILVAGHKAVDPPLIQVNDAVIGTARTFPGGVSYVDAQALRELGGVRPIAPLETGGNIPLGREMQADTRAQIEAAFFKTAFNLPVAGPQMTATEVLERKEEFLRTLGPVLGRLETDYIGMVPQRAFMIMMRAHAFDPPPPALKGGKVRFAVSSAIEQARRQIEAAGAARAMELLAPFLAAKPELMDNFDIDAIARDVPDIFGLPRRWLRSQPDVDAARQARAQGQQAAELLHGAGKVAEIAQRLSQASPAEATPGGGRL